MSAVNPDVATAHSLVAAIEEFIAEAVRLAGGKTSAINPGHRVPFHWPPHPISYKYHVLVSDWSGRASFEAHGEIFDVSVARTPHGVFGRCETLWHEARGESLEEMLRNLREEAEPLFSRQFAIARTLGLDGRFNGHLRDLSPEQLLRLLYCPDRDVANEARTEIETQASRGIFLPALITILRDRRHPMRRSAQWCVLDLFEDLPSFCGSDEEEIEAVQSMKDLVWDAEDDFARTTFKAGVVLGGHMPDELGARALLECLSSPSRIGRRSAIHGVFHVVEWNPSFKQRVLESLRQVGRKDPDPQLREYAALMADDIEAARTDHIPEPVFPDEQ